MGHTDTSAISVSVVVVGQSEAEEKQKEEEEVKAEERSERRRNESRNSSWGDPKVTNLRAATRARVCMWVVRIRVLELPDFIPPE